VPKKRVLLVDDNTGVRSLVRQLFESESDFEISGEAENGREAVEKAENPRPDLITSDLSMPVMTGLDAAPLLRKLLPDTRIILFTVQEGREVEQLADRPVLPISAFPLEDDSLFRNSTEKEVKAEEDSLNGKAELGLKCRKGLAGGSHTNATD
jgi:CheY-like chemotaxis protein